MDDRELNNRLEKIELTLDSIAIAVGITTQSLSEITGTQKELLEVIEEEIQYNDNKKEQEQTEEEDENEENETRNKRNIRFQEKEEWPNKIHRHNTTNNTNNNSNNSMDRWTIHKKWHTSNRLLWNIRTTSIRSSTKPNRTKIRKMEINEKDIKEIEEELEKLRQNKEYTEQRDKKLEQIKKYTRPETPEKYENEQEQTEEETEKIKLNFFKKLTVKKLTKQLKETIQRIQTQSEDNKQREKIIDAIISLNEIFEIEIEGKPATEKTLRKLNTKELLEIITDGVKMLEKIV